MNIIFVTLGRTTNIHVHGIYSDLMRKFHKEGHSLYIVYPLERKEGKPTSLTNEDGVHYLGVWTFNIQKTAHLQSSVFKLSKDLIDSIHEEGIVAYTS